MTHIETIMPIPTRTRARKEAPRSKGVYEKVSGSDIWWIRYADANGKIRREKAGNKGAAIKLYAKRKTEVLQGKKLPEQLRAKRITFSELAKDALAYSKAHKRSYRHDEYRMKALEEEFGSRDATSITHQELTTWLQDRGEEQDWLPATYNRQRALLSLVFRLGIENGKVTQNPARLVRHRKENNERVRWLSAEEEAALREALSTKPEWRDRIPDFEIALHSGMRLSEMYGIDWANVDLDRRVLLVPRSKHGEARHVRLNSVAVEAFKTVLERSGSEKKGNVFTWGCETDRMRHEWFNAAVLAAEIDDFRWHDLRHSFASRLVMNTVSLRVVQELLGHKTIHMTCRYAHLAPSVELEAVEGMAAFWQAKVAKATKDRTSVTAESGILDAVAGDLQNEPTDTKTSTRDSAVLLASTA
jgi:site-specific recombinase XerD